MDDLNQKVIAVNKIIRNAPILNISVISHENLNNGKFYDDYKHVNRTSGVAVLAKNIKLGFNPKMQGRVSNKYYNAHKYDNMKKVDRNDNMKKVDRNDNMKKVDRNDNMKKVDRNDVTPLQPKPKGDSISTILQEIMKQLTIMNINSLIWPHCHQELLLHLTQGVYL